MNSRLREIIFITSLSFTLVILFNALFLYFHLSTIINPTDILVVFIVCLFIAVAISVADLIPFARKHTLFYSYAVMYTIAMGMQTLIFQSFYWQNFFFQTMILTIIFFCVAFGVYGIHYKNAWLINKKLKEKRKINQK